MTTLYVVKQHIDYLDTQPTISAPMERWEAEEVASEWLMDTISHIVQHSPYSIGEEEYERLVEQESTLIKIEECTA
jgi:hypothetical protein